MISAVLFFALLASAILAVRKIRPRETRLVLSAAIDLPVHSIFEVIGDARKTPSWRRQPRWLPGPLRVSTLARWGEHIPLEQRSPGARRGASEEISIRCIADREFGFRSVLRNEPSYESILHIIPENGKCRITWEIWYETRRLPDLVRRKSIAQAARASMADSLEYIQRLALLSAAPVSSRSRIHEAQRGQIPAA
jgi:hypothetical protein